MNINYSEALKYIRKTATKNGLTFKKTSTILNGAALWRLEDKIRGDNVIDNYQFWTAYNDACIGYIDTFNKKTGIFESVKIR